MSALAVYRNFREDSTRWDGLAARPDDVVVTTPVKAGTTWLQTICAMLIFGSPELPAPLAALSPWVDSKMEPEDALHRRLAAQQHRRVLKSHTPLDGLPERAGVRYVTGARDPLDIAVSFYHQMSNLDLARLSEKLRLPVRAEDGPLVLPPLREWLTAWVTQDVSDVRAQSETLPGVLHHIQQSWLRRDHPQVLLVHYADLSADLDAQMRRIAAHLDIEVPEARWPGLVEAATFAHMRRRADQLAPGEPFKDRTSFFRQGTSGAGAAVLSEPELLRYRARVRELTSPDLAAWLLRQPG
ncbi:sulfotransferase domain-containing protein [Catenuloplanes japonicus]|uniref:sulfotransferase domain-containing protein n=1 Tax=Catenuloplanes japonicus TaxID=33876 RepID=UPI0005265840|nr:sulfotransferase domain-containing protein [Catenuloplanes japonicus]